MSDDPEQDMDELAAELAVDAAESFESNKRDQAAFLDDVAEEEGAEELTTTCDIHGHTVDVSATLNGELMDAMSRIDERLERLDGDEGRAYEFSETADDVCQLLADVTEEAALTKRAFYRTYEQHGLNPLGVVLEEVFTALKNERERREGVADGFRSQ